jgi:predicted TPR repeat methyltransferase
MEFLGPQHINTALERILFGASGLCVLDLGCGTGLCGACLKPRAKHLVGVDLSQPMLDSAHDKNVYDELMEQEAVRFLQSRIAVFDLIVGSGVVIFFSDLRPVFSAVHAALRDQGYFVFTLYKSDIEEIVIRDNIHFAHSEKYVKSCASAVGLKIVEIEYVVHEFDSGRPQPGFVVILQKQPQ